MCFNGYIVKVCTVIQISVAIGIGSLMFESFNSQTCELNCTCSGPRVKVGLIQEKGARPGTCLVSYPDPPPTFPLGVVWGQD